MIRIIATFRVELKEIENAIEIAELLVKETRRKDDCVQYDLLQADHDETHLVVVEQWEEQAKLDAHAASEHYKKYVPMLAQLCKTAPEVLTYKSLL